MKLATFIRKTGIRTTIERIAARTDGVKSFGSDSSHFRVTFRLGRKSMTVQYSQGSGHNGKMPKAQDVLDCIASDVSGFEGRSFAEWASDSGYSAQPEAQKTYRMIGRQETALHSVLGSALVSELLECERL